MEYSLTFAVAPFDGKYQNLYQSYISYLFAWFPIFEILALQICYLENVGKDHTVQLSVVEPFDDTNKYL